MKSALNTMCFVALVLAVLGLGMIGAGFVWSGFDADVFSTGSTMSAASSCSAATRLIPISTCPCSPASRSGAPSGRFHR